MPKSVKFGSLKKALKPRFRWLQLRYLLGLVGLREGLSHYLFGKTNGEYWIQPKSTQLSLCVRHNSSDILVLGQVFFLKEYSCLDNLREVGLIIDCGANVGYSTAYFLSKHPNCYVVAVEPEAANFALLTRNLASFADRVSLLNAGVWSQTARLAITLEAYRDGREWSKQVRVCEPDESSDIDGIDLGSILRASGYQRISLLKMDIEGAEAVVFSENYLSWLDKVDTIAIELHADTTFGNAHEIFFSAIAGRGFEVHRQGDLTICTKPEDRSSR